MIPASAVTVLDRNGHEAALIDGNNSKMTTVEFEKALSRFNPDVIVLETKTPIMPRLWRYVNKIKESYEHVVFVGDHVTGLPGESLERCRVDYVITGGDYDLSLLRLVDYVDGSSEEVPGGVWHSRNGTSQRVGPAPLWDHLDDVPFIDRELTGWRLYGEAYLKKPCTYILTGRGCGGTGISPGICSFCVWQHTLWGCTYRARSPSNVAEEIASIVDSIHVKEIFDDNESGMTWNYEWLEEFGRQLKERGMAKVYLSSNSRADSLTKKTCSLLSRLGFRLLKIGVESGNDGTLKKIRKLETVEQIERGVKNAKDVGLKVLMTVMVGYPWEGTDEVRQTLRLIRKLMRYKAKIGDSMQASVIIPYPGTPLHEYASKEGLFTINPSDYEAYDMSRPVLHSPIEAGDWCEKLWKLHYDPVFLLKSIGSLRSMDDIKLATKGIISLMGHTEDFS
jgi:radical SAM superfamily enzyme YgiQ (UPF0313 family)